MNSQQLPTSWGELFDKITILQIHGRSTEQSTQKNILISTQLQTEV